MFVGILSLLDSQDSYIYDPLSAISHAKQKTLKNQFFSANYEVTANE
jgi:hypothetical protein